MRGIKIIINGQPTYLPYNKQTIALYEERNNLLRGKAKEQEETATILQMTEEEVNQYLYAAVIPSTAGISSQAQSGVDINKLMELLITQQTELAELKKQISAGYPVPNIAAGTPSPKGTKKTVSLPIKLDDEKGIIPDPVLPGVITDELQDFT